MGYKKAGILMTGFMAVASVANAVPITFVFNSSDLTKVGTADPAIPTQATFLLNSDAQDDFGASSTAALYQTEGPQVSFNMGGAEVDVGQGVTAAVESLSSDSVTFMGDDGSVLVRIDLGDQSNPLNLLDGVTPMDLANNFTLSEAETSSIVVEMDGVRYEGTIDGFFAEIAAVPSPSAGFLAAIGVLTALGYGPRLVRPELDRS